MFTGKGHEGMQRAQKRNKEYKIQIYPEKA